MSTPIAGYDATLFEAYLKDKITARLSVSVHVNTPHASANVYGVLTQCAKGEYLVRSPDQMSRVSFNLSDIRSMGDLCIFLKL